MLDIKKMRAASEAGQWSLDKFDWDAPGRPDREEAVRYQGFLSDVVWIELVAEPVFQAMTRQVEDADLAAVYDLFGRDERRHAEAEMALMRRWRLLKAGEMPMAERNVMRMYEALAKHSHALHPSVLSGMTPLLELLLDGALVRFLYGQVTDPVFRDVFDHINKDESRHIAIDFYALEHFAETRGPWQLVHDSARACTNAHLMQGLLFGFFPYVARARDNLASFGMDFTLIRKMLRRYIDLGESNAAIRKNPVFRAVRVYARKLERDDYRLEDALLRLSDAVGDLSFAVPPTVQPAD